MSSQQQARQGARRANRSQTRSQGSVSNQTGPNPPGRPEPRSGRHGGFSSELEAILANRIAMAGLPLPEIQFRFCLTRRWRADFAWPAQRVIVEVQGGVWTNGRHARGSGIVAEAEKLCTAAAMGYRVLPVTRDMIEDGRAVRLIAQALDPLPSPGGAAGSEEG